MSSFKDSSSASTINTTSQIPVIALAGMAESGKTTVFEYIKTKYPNLKFSFSDSLKPCCKILWNLTDAQLYTPIGKRTVDERWDVKPRQMMQCFGDLVCDFLPSILPYKLPVYGGMRSNLFIEEIMRKIREARERKESFLIVIDDLRKPDENQALLSLSNVTTIKIIRNTNSCDPHITEKLSFDCMFTIYNDGTLEKLYKEVDKILSTINISN